MTTPLSDFEYVKAALEYAHNHPYGDGDVTYMFAQALAMLPIIEAALPKAEYPECSGNPDSCPENEGYGCKEKCK